MKFTLKWLKEHLDTSATPSAIGDALTRLGMELEELRDLSESVKGIIVGHVLDAKKHPEADRLQVCQVDIGTETPVQVVCGAPNARANLKVAFAAPGVVIPSNGMQLKLTKIRGVESSGMLCSAAELCLEAESPGIIELSEDAPIRASVASILNLNDVVFDIAVTPNRGDWLGVRGIARDLAAAGVGTLLPLPDLSFKTVGPNSIHISIENGTSCYQYMGRLIKNVKNGPSSDWFRNGLERVGHRTISAVVDVTNCISVDLCRPLHAFDAAKLQGNIVVRKAKEGEEMLGLDGVTYKLSPTITVIADDAGPIAIGGILGGERTACTDETTDVFLECAYWDPVGIALAGRELNLHTDARARLERGVDPLGVAFGLDRATDLMLRTCGGQAYEAISVGTLPKAHAEISFNPSFVEKITGVVLEMKHMQEILEALGFIIAEKSSTNWQVTPPSWRHDIVNGHDLVEEIVRVYGYDHIATTPLPTRVSATPLSRPDQQLFQARALLASRGLHEVITWSMVSESLFHAFDGKDASLEIDNPITQELKFMRPSILPGLLLAAQRNAAHGLLPINLFEIGPVFPKIDEQQTMIAGLRCGILGDDDWRTPKRTLDAFDVKNDVWALLTELGIATASVQIVQEDLPSYFHPGRAARLQQGPKKVLGYFGMLHPKLMKAFDLRVPCAVFECAAEALIGNKRKGKFVAPDLQSVSRDLAFFVPDTVPAQKVLEAIYKADRALITHVNVFDVYQGTGVPAGFVSLALRMHLQPQTETLTDAQLHEIMNKAISAVQVLGATLRGS